MVRVMRASAMTGKRSHHRCIPAHFRRRQHDAIGKNRSATNRYAEIKIGLGHVSTYEQLPLNTAIVVVNVKITERSYISGKSKAVGDVLLLIIRHLRVGAAGRVVPKPHLPQPHSGRSVSHLRLNLNTRSGP